MMPEIPRVRVRLSWVGRVWITPVSQRGHRVTATAISPKRSLTVRLDSPATTLSGAL